MKPGAGRLAALRHKRALAAATALCVVAGVCAYWLLFGRSMSPQEVCDRAVAALRDRDADTLYDLADPTEIRKTHITRAAVHDILNQTIWLHGKPTFRGPFEREPAGLAAADLAQWVSTPPGGGCDDSMGVDVVLSRDGRWYVNLSNILLAACAWDARNPCDNHETGVIFRALARRNGIIKRRIYEGYIALDAVGSPELGTMPVDRSE